MAFSDFDWSELDDLRQLKEDHLREIKRLREAIRSAAMHIFKARERFLTHDYIDKDHGWIVEDHLNAAKEALEQSPFEQSIHRSDSDG